MGTFKIEIEAVGGHGCEREVADGGVVSGCSRMGCPDCEARRFLRHFLDVTGATLVKGTLTHWPGTPGEVVDDLHTKIRKGHF